MDEARQLAALPLASLLTTKRLMVDPHRAALKAANAAENEGLAELSGGPANIEAVASMTVGSRP